MPSGLRAKPPEHVLPAASYGLLIRHRCLRFMMLMIPKGYEQAKPGTMPDAKAVDAMNEVQRVAAEGRRAARARWAPSALDGRAHFLPRRQGQGDRRTLRRGQGGAGRLLDNPGEVSRGGDRVGLALPGLGERDHRGTLGAGVLGLPSRCSGSRGPVPRGEQARTAQRRVTRTTVSKRQGSPSSSGNSSSS